MEDHNFLDVQNMRNRAHFIRRSYIEEMEKHLLAFENKVHDNNIEVKWVVDEQDLSEIILSFLPKSHYNKVCFDISNIPENIQSHGNLIKNIPLKELEDKAETAEILITEADFAVVETGDIVLIDKGCKNCFNQIQNLLIILDLNKLVVRESDLETIIYMQSLYKHNRYLPNDIKFISKPPKRVIVEDIFSSNKQNFFTEEIKIYLQSHTTFLYDMDKIRNFLSYMVRYASQKDFMDKYIPSNLTESYNFREIHFNKLPIEYVDKTIEAKFSEEIKLIKRYYLTYRIYTMR